MNKILDSNIKLKRAYEVSEPSDGKRYLVDRLWPRGVSKQKADLTGGWLKDIAPSTELRKWFNHDPKKWNEFQKKYIQELKGSVQQQDLNLLKQEASNGIITLVFGAKNTTENEAIVIKDELTK